MKKTYFLVSTVSVMLYGIVDFLKNWLDRYLHVQLILGAASYQSSNFYVDARRCQTVLLTVALVGAVLFVLATVRDCKKA